MKDGKAKLNLGAFVERSTVNGPGPRAVVWLQGCLKRCQGCANPQFWNTSARQFIEPDELVQRILLLDGIEGVTYTGGEPFLQAASLVYVSRSLKAAGLSVMSYTGSTYDEILGSSNRDWIDLLAFLDVLVDGEFVNELREPLLWRGSSNQQVHFLTDRYRDFEKQVNETRSEFEIHITDGRLLITGFIGEQTEKRLLEYLGKGQGLIVEVCRV